MLALTQQQEPPTAGAQHGNQTKNIVFFHRDPDFREGNNGNGYTAQMPGYAALHGVKLGCQEQNYFATFPPKTT